MAMKAAHRLICLALVLMAGCSSEQLYATGRNAQRAECMKRQDRAEQERCLKDAGLSYDSYKREADAAVK
jgi:hypothetical protein